MYSLLIPFRYWLLPCLVVFILTLLGQCIYRLKYHPLAKYPGPWLAKVTNLYGAYHALHGDLHVDMQRCHAKYGNILRYGPDRVLINSTTALRDINDHSKPVKKSKAYATISHIARGENIVTIIDKSLHRSKRRLYNPEFSPEALSNFEPTMVDHIRVFCNQLVQKTSDDHGGWTKAKNVKDLCNWVVFDIGGDFVFGQKFRTLVTTENRFLIDAILAVNIRTGVHAQCPKLANLPLQLIWSPIGLQTIRKCLQWRRSIVEKLKSHDKPIDGLFFKVVGVKYPEAGHEVSYNEMLAEAQFLQIAAFETTATTLAAALFYLAHYSDAYSTLAQEVRSSFANAEEIVSGSKLKSCKFLSACIQETLRMSPTVPGAMWREVEPGGAWVDGEFIPAGYDVGICIYALHHKESYFGDSFRFAPNRWLAMGPEADLKVTQNAYTPFSVGPRACIGRSLALAEVSIALARVMWLMDFRTADTTGEYSGGGTRKAMDGRNKNPEYQLYAHLTSYSHGPMLEFRKRHG